MEKDRLSFKISINRAQYNHLVWFGLVNPASKKSGITIAVQMGLECLLEKQVERLNYIRRKEEEKKRRIETRERKRQTDNPVFIEDGERDPDKKVERWESRNDAGQGMAGDQSIAPGLP